MFLEDENIVRDNIYWQVLKSKKRTIKLFNAYLDVRMEKPVVRVTLLTSKLDISKDPIYCQLYFKDALVLTVVKASEVFLTGREKWSTSKKVKWTYLLTCPVESEDLPISVSLTLDSCENAENRLDIIDNQPLDGVKKKFGVCTKQMKYSGLDFVVKFIEWIHLLHLMGVSKVHLTITEVHEEMIKVLEYFEKLDLIEWKRYKDPTDIADDILFSGQHRFLQMLVENDCFYRTRHLYEHIALIDPDEIIMPLMESDLTWEDVWNRLNLTSSDTDSVEFANVYFPQLNERPWPEIPNYDYMMQHVKRTKVDTKEVQAKSFFQPDNIIVVYNHKAWKCHRKSDFSCNTASAPSTIAQLNHYRNEMKKVVKSNIKDRTIWKYKNELINAVEETLNYFNFQPEA